MTALTESDCQQNLWMHRISHEAEVSYPLLQQGLLSIGFSDFVDREMEVILRTDSTDKAWEHLNQTCKDCWKSIPRTRHNLMRFIREMEVGDWVIVPSWGNFSVYEITERACAIHQAELAPLQTWHEIPCSMQGKHIYNATSDKSYDIGYVLRVKPIAKEIPRSGYADAKLTSRMKYRGTNINCNDYKDSIKAALKAWEKKRPINLHSLILKDTQEAVLKLIREQLNPDKLERLIFWYFTQLGASSIIPAKNESGKEGDGDIVATFSPLKTIYYIQAKHHTGITDDWAIEQITAYTDYKGSNAKDEDITRIPWVITTADSFSETAKRKASESNVLLINGPDLAQMLLEVGISGLDEGF